MIRLLRLIIRSSILCTVVCLGCGIIIRAQSTSLDYPTPVTGNQLAGAIQARDIGDSRVTRHYYVLSGTTGDLTITVQYTNLNGDIDLFTADGMRPLAKIGLVASDNTIKVDRTVFLRIHENLILRVEAKSANDDPGRYQISFTGTFEPIASAAEAPPPPTVESKSGSNNRRRVTTAGEVIIEPEPPPVAKVEPPPAPKVTPKPSAATATSKPPAKRGTSATTGRSAPNTTASNRTPTNTPRKPRPGKPKATASNTETAQPEENPASEPATTPPVRPTAKKPTTARNSGRATKPAPTPTPKPEPEPDPMANARLVVDTRDGERQEHYMRDVRRFTVEKGVLLVILKDGKIERQPMSNVLRVVIEP